MLTDNWPGAKWRTLPVISVQSCRWCNKLLLQLNIVPRLASVLAAFRVKEGAVDHIKTKSEGSGLMCACLYIIYIYIYLQYKYKG